MIPAGVPPPIEVHAERLAIEDGLVRATGGVTMTRAGETLTADEGVFSLEDQLLVLSGGALQQGGVTLSFAQATVRLQAEDALLSGVVADGLGWHLSGAEVLVLPDGTLVVSEAVATGCEPGCGARVPWELHARSAVVDPGETLRVLGGSVHVYGVPLVPVPQWITTLDPHKPHLEAPVLGWVDGQPAVRLPFRWGHASGLSMRAAIGYWRGPSTDVAARWGDDSTASTEALWADGAPRGQASVHHAWVNEALRFGVDGQLVSDPGWQAGRGRTLAERSAPWSDLRAIGGVGPARLELTAVQTDAPTVRWTPAAVLTTPTRELGPVLGSGTARFDLVDGDLRSEARGTAWTVARGGLAEAELRITGRALAYEATPGGVDAAAWAEVRVPTWRDGVLGRQEWVLGARARAGQHWGPDASQSWEVWDEGVRVGPLVQTVAWGAGETHGQAELWVPWDTEQWGVVGNGRLARGPLSVGGQAQWRDGEGLLAGRVGWTGDVSGLWAQAALAGGDTPSPTGRAGAWTTLTGSHNTWHTAATVLATADGLGEARVALDWQSGCDCLLIGTAVGWASDQTGPSVSLRLDLTP